MSKFFLSLSKASTASIIAILIIIGVIIMVPIILFHPPANENLAILVVGQLFSLAGFVAGYYFNKKQGKDEEITP